MSAEQMCEIRCITQVTSSRIVTHLLGWTGHVRVACISGLLFAVLQITEVVIIEPAASDEALVARVSGDGPSALIFVGTLAVVEVEAAFFTVSWLRGRIRRLNRRQARRLGGRLVCRLVSLFSAPVPSPSWPPRAIVVIVVDAIVVRWFPV